MTGEDRTASGDGTAQLRVLSVLPSIARNTGGPAINLVQATKALAPGVRRALFCTDASEPAASQGFTRVTPAKMAEGADQIDLHIFRTRRPYSFIFSPGLFRAIGRVIRQYDLVTIHSTNLFPQFAAYYHCRRTRTPYVVTPHGSLDPWLSNNSPRRKAVINALWQRRMFENASALHFTAQLESELARNVAPRVPRRIVPNGVDTARFESLPDGRLFREKFLDGHEGPVILFLSRIARKKGLDILISAFSMLPESSNALLVIVGPDDEGIVPGLAEQAAGLGLRDRVRFLGPLYGPERDQALAAADVWALISHTENFGNAVVEAMAAGLPTVITEAVNIYPDIQAAEAGLITARDAGAVARDLALLLDDEPRRRRLGASAREFARRYDWTQVAPRLEEMYRDAAGRGD